MTWYNILFFTVLAIFIIKTAITLIAGDIDVDFDVDGDIDFDISSMVSFKGILHFLLGFSTYLAAIAKFGTKTLSTFNESTLDYNLVYDFKFVDYIIAIVIGVIFTIGLWYLYKLMMKFNHSSDEIINLSGYKCNITTNLGNGKYEVLVKTPGGVFKETVKSYTNNDNLEIGGEFKIIRSDGEYYI